MARFVRRAARSAVLALALALSTVGGQATAEPATDILSASGYRMVGNASRMRVLLNFAQKPTVKWFLLRGPHRLVVDMPETRFAIDPHALKARGMITGVRYGDLDEGRSRLILTSKGPFSVEALDILPNDDGSHRLVVDLIAAPEHAFEEALSKQAEGQITGALPKEATEAKAEKLAEAVKPPADRKFTVVLDAGHGGIDGGAESRTGAMEKDITLAFSRELRDLLAAKDSYNVRMTRDEDKFLRLDERVRIAREYGADLFISIHADTIRLKGISGATVYTLSDKASDAESAALAVRENLSDELAGMVIEDADHQVADILVDLIKRETHGFSIRFARTLLGELKGHVDLIGNPHRSAGFRVLRAPDIPSVLVELGYLSNEKDEAQLRDKEWRARAARSILEAVDRFAAEKVAARG